jgi:hypothetical protein
MANCAALDSWGEFEEATTSQAYSISSGTNRLLVALVYIEDQVDIQPTVTWGDATLTEFIAPVISGTDYESRVSAYYLKESGIAGATGTNVGISFDTTPDTWHIIYRSFQYVNQTDPIVDINSYSTGTSDGGDNPPTSIDLTGVSGNYAIAGGMQGGTSGGTSWASGLTEVVEQYFGGTARSSTAEAALSSGGTVQARLTWTSFNRRADVSFQIQGEDNGSGATGTLSVTLGTLTLAGTGTQTNEGTLASTLGVLTLAGTGTQINTGTLASTLGALTVAATGTQVNEGALAETFGALTASATGTVVADQVVAGTAANFVAADNDSLTLASAVVASGDFTVLLWWKPTASGSSHLIGSGTTNWYINAGLGGEVVSMYITDTVTGSANTAAVAAANGSWHLVVGQYDSAAKKCGISVDASAMDLSGALANGLSYGTTFSISDATLPTNGAVDEVYVFNRLLSADEITALYASGAGRFYDFNTL